MKTNAPDSKGYVCWHPICSFNSSSRDKLALNCIMDGDSDDNHGVQVVGIYDDVRADTAEMTEHGKFKEEEEKDVDTDGHLLVDHQHANKNEGDDHGIEPSKTLNEGSVVIELEQLCQPLNGRFSRIDKNYNATQNTDICHDDDEHESRDNQDRNGVEDTIDQTKKNGTRIFIAVKATYFLFVAGVACLLPFLPVYMSYLGLGVMDIGIINTLGPFFAMAASSVCGTLSDRFSLHKVMLLTCYCATALVYGSSVFMPFISPSLSTHMNFKHTEQNASNATSYMEQTLNVFYHVDPEKSGGNYSCRFQNTTHSDFMDLRTCKFSIIDRRNTSNIASFLENLCGCSFTDFTTITASDHENGSRRNGDGVVPNEICLLYNDLMKAYVDQYNLIECDLSAKYKDSFNGAVLVNMYDETHYLNGSASQTHDMQEGDYLDIFVIMLAICLIGSMFKFSAEPLLDASTMTLIDEFKEIGQNFEYGRQRVFGAIALAIFAPLSGIVVSSYASVNPDGFNLYLPAFILFVSMIALSTATASRIPIRVKQQITKYSFRDAKDIILTPKVIVFFCVMFTIGVMMSFVKTYLFLFIAEINGDETVMGLSLTVCCVAEVPFMMFASLFIDKLGHRSVLGIALAGYVVRFICYSLLQNPWSVLPIELLHGITFGSMWPAAVSYIHQNSPPDLASTLQSLTQSITNGFGQGVGILIGGVIYDNFGARILFGGSAILSLVTLVLYFVVSLILDRQERDRGYDKL
ncbi:major facilitator superfamily domain-containing protein 6-like isoform X2 [Lytechinus variegatus]|uniref:major facilitator superfamily domain-containing protein 6-like isoform X2 n=1 Tax=Lytechinus variegatus TaxID=7654 RepID=UPI001BB12D6D|nr:major facilitator superfamily domain-containing protein 6-like isoform X2 [Lytechinus variegatus]